MSRNSTDQYDKNLAGFRNSMNRAIERYDNVERTFATELSNLAGFFNDPDRPALKLNINRRDDGGFLAIAEREEDMQRRVIFAYGEDIVHALLMVSDKMAADAWKDSKPWKPD